MVLFISSLIPSSSFLMSKTIQHIKFWPTLYSNPGEKPPLYTTPVSLNNQRSLFFVSSFTLPTLIFTFFPCSYHISFRFFSSNSDTFCAGHSFSPLFFPPYILFPGRFPFFSSTLSLFFICHRLLVFADTTNFNPTTISSIQGCSFTLFLVILILPHWTSLYLHFYPLHFIMNKRLLDKSRFFLLSRVSSHPREGPI